jgi:predicted Zn-dependent protease
MAVKASIYQAEGDLREAAKFLTEINAQTPSGTAVGIKVNQLRLERNLAEAIRLLKDREVHYHFGSDREKCVNELMLALVQRVDGNVAGTQAAAEQARHTLEPLCRNQPTNAYVVAMSSLASSVLGQRDLAIEEAERAITLLPASQDRVFGPTREENLALVQMMLGENGLATSNLSRLVQTPYSSWLYSPIPLTRMLLTLDPLWDPLRTDPAFKKLCEEKQQ